MKKFTRKEALALGLSGAGVGISAANLATNLKRGKESREYQEKQLKAMDRLTKSLNKVDSSLEKIDTKKEEEPKRIVRFFQKNNSHTKDLAYKGGVLGGTLAGGSIFLPKVIGKVVKEETKTNQKGDTYKVDVFKDNPNYKHPKFKAKYNSLDPAIRGALIEIGGIAIGAALGALAGAIMDISEAISRKNTVNNRLMKDILVNLKKMGFQEGRDYTRDPKVSSLIKTKVCLVISKSSDELRLLINTVNDSNLKSITEKITKNLPTMSTVNEKVSDRFNEINITTMTSNNGDSVWIASIAEKFIREKYPVYLVEVG